MTRVGLGGCVFMGEIFLLLEITPKWRYFLFYSLNWQVYSKMCPLLFSLLVSTVRHPNTILLGLNYHMPFYCSPSIFHPRILRQTENVTFLKHLILIKVLKNVKKIFKRNFQLKPCLAAGTFRPSAFKSCGIDLKFLVSSLRINLVIRDRNKNGL